MLRPVQVIIMTNKNNRLFLSNNDEARTGGNVLLSYTGVPVLSSNWLWPKPNELESANEINTVIKVTVRADRFCLMHPMLRADLLSKV